MPAESKPAGPVPRDARGTAGLAGRRDFLEAGRRYSTPISGKEDFNESQF
jgi:hypothetical protein